MINSLEDAQNELADVFAVITNGKRPFVKIVTRDEQNRPLIAVTFVGDMLVEMCQIEAYVTEQGDSVRHRSQRKGNLTHLIFATNPKPKN